MIIHRLPNFSAAACAAPLGCCEILARSLELGFSKLPIYKLREERFDELRTSIAEVDVVSMLPHIEGEQRLVALLHRRTCIGSVDDRERAVGLLHKPGPAGTKVAGSGL